MNSSRETLASPFWSSSAKRSGGGTDWCGVAGTGRRVKFHVAVLYLFDEDDTSGKLSAERIYFDNETVMKQINGDAEAASVPQFGDRQMAVAE